MQTYLTRFRRQNYEHPSTTMDSYMEAYKLSHDNYQMRQEEMITQIAKENADFIKRVKRSAAPDPPHEKDFIKFELTDAIQPDKETLKNRELNQGRNYRRPFEIADTIVYGNKTQGTNLTFPAIDNNPKQTTTSTEKPKETRRGRRRRPVKKEKQDTAKPKSDTSNNESGDLSSGESKRFKVYSTLNPKQNGELPIGVKKAIELVLQQEKSRLSKTRAPKNQKPYSDKTQNTEESRKTAVREAGGIDYRPQYSLGRYPMVHTQMENAPEFLTFVPIKAYKTVAYGKPMQPIQEMKPKPTMIPVPVPEIRYIIKEVPIPVSTLFESEKLKPSVKVTYDTSLIDGKFKPSVQEEPIPYYESIETQTKPTLLEGSKSYATVITPTSATKSFIYHAKPPPKTKKVPSKNEYESLKVEDLESLLSKEPEEQLKGFNELLKEENKFEAPQKSTAPLLFHPYGITPSKPKIKLNIKGNY